MTSQSLTLTDVERIRRLRAEISELN